MIRFGRLTLYLIVFQIAQVSVAFATTGVVVPDILEMARPVAESLRTTGTLPSHYHPKPVFRLFGWTSGAPRARIPGAAIGGDLFQNRLGTLPEAPGRAWFEVDIGPGTRSGAPSEIMKRGRFRLLYSSDGLLYVSADHYYTYRSIGRWSGPGSSAPLSLSPTTHLTVRDGGRVVTSVTAAELEAATRTNPTTPVAAESPAGSFVRSARAIRADRALRAARSPSLIRLPSTLTAFGDPLGSAAVGMEGIAVGYVEVIRMSVENDERVERGRLRECNELKENAYDNWRTEFFRRAGVDLQPTMSRQSIQQQLETFFDTQLRLRLPSDWDPGSERNQKLLHSMKVDLIRTVLTSTAPITAENWASLWSGTIERLMQGWFMEESNWTCPVEKIRFEFDGIRWGTGHTYPQRHGFANLCSGNMYRVRRAGPRENFYREDRIPTTLTAKIAKERDEDYVPMAESVPLIRRHNENEARPEGERCTHNGMRADWRSRMRSVFGADGYFSFAGLDDQPYDRRTTQPMAFCTTWTQTLSRLLDGEGASSGYRRGKLGVMGRNDFSKTEICRVILGDDAYQFTGGDTTERCRTEMERAANEIRPLFSPENRRRRDECVWHDETFTTLEARARADLGRYEGRDWERGDGLSYSDFQLLRGISGGNHD